MLHSTAWPRNKLPFRLSVTPGYVGGAHYKMFGGNNWVSNVLLTAALFCGPVIPAFAFLNTVAIFYGSMVALPFGTIVIIVVIWLVVTFPLTVLGGIAAKNGKGEFNAPCRCVGGEPSRIKAAWHRFQFKTVLYRVQNCRKYLSYIPCVPYFLLNLLKIRKMGRKVVHAKHCPRQKGLRLDRLQGSGLTQHYEGSWHDDEGKPADRAKPTGLH